MPNSAARMLRVAAARADFLENGRAGAAGVPDVVAASWERSQAAGVDASARTAPSPMTSTPAHGWFAAPSRYWPSSEADTADMPLVIALTDNRARVVRRIDVSTAVGRLLDRVDFAPGFDYAESTMGTNGVGTVLEAGQTRVVVGPEHFSENLHLFACTGAPMIDPVTGRVEGMLDVSTLADAWSPLMHTLVEVGRQGHRRNLLHGPQPVPAGDLRDLPAR